MALGSYVPIAWVNGGPPPIDADNLLSHEEVLELSDQELRRSQCVNFEKSKLKEYFWERNTKEIEDFEDYTEWSLSSASTTASDDTTNNILNKSSVKFLENDNTAGWIGIYKDIAALDLSIFNDGSASTTSDLIYLFFYITDVTKFNWFQFKLGQDNANNYTYAVAAAGFSNGFNYLIAAKSDFTPVGAPPGWNNITHLRVEASTTINAQNQYITCIYWQMIREDPVWAGYPSICQEYMGNVTGWENRLEVWDDLVSIVWDDKINRSGILLMPAKDTKALYIYLTIQSFISYIEQYCKYEDYSVGLCWYSDTDNYIQTYMDNGIFYLEAIEGGVSSNVNVALSETLLKNERIIIKFEKDNDTCRAILYKNGEQIHILEYETSIDTNAEGHLFISCHSSNGYALITDFAVSSNYGDLHLHNEWNKGPRLYQLSSDQTYLSNTITAIDDFLIRLPANRTFKIEAFFYANNAGSANPDIRIDWDNSGVTLLAYRNCIGGEAIASSSEPSSTNKVRMSVQGLSTVVHYAIPSMAAPSSPINETFIILTGLDGGYIQARAAQYDTDGTKPLIILKESFIIVTEVFR
jgi:hypothetical protein